MKPIEAARFMLALTLATIMAAASAADPSAEEHGAHHPDTAQAAPAGTAPAPPPASIPALQQRMRAIRETKDPERRMALMDEQMQAMESMMQGMPADCPMMGGGQGPDIMRDHMQKMEKHLETMQRMMEMHMKTPSTAPGG